MEMIKLINNMNPLPFSKSRMEKYDCLTVKEEGIVWYPLLRCYGASPFWTDISQFPIASRILVANYSYQQNEQTIQHEMIVTLVSDIRWLVSVYYLDGHASPFPWTHDARVNQETAPCHPAVESTVDETIRLIRHFYDGDKSNLETMQ